jgi:ech hydrogenase subunit F
MPWMIKTVIGNLFSAPATRRYPYVKRADFAGSRGLVCWDGNKCDLCGDCARICPANAIEVDEAGRTISYEHTSCIFCGSCMDTCLQRAISQQTGYAPARLHKRRKVFNIGNGR